MHKAILSVLTVCLALGAAVQARPAMAEEPAVYGPELQGFDYPYPVKRHGFSSQEVDVEMAYLDVRPETANGHTVVLLHGKNFCAATWAATIDALLKAGFRVVAPDQIGFCKSTKPHGYQYSLHQLAANTHALLRSLDVEKATVIGHSMGGMLAFRYALMYPAATEKLITVNPIGLEDWKAKGVPWQPIETAFENGLGTSFEGIKAYQLKHYYANGWRSEYDKWVEMQAGMYREAEAARVNAWAQAKTSDMIFTQPVVYEFPEIAVPSVLMIGMLDTTAPGANRASETVAETLGDYPVLARETEAAIPGARLIAFEDLGHSPHIEAPARFLEALLGVLD